MVISLSALEQNDNKALVFTDNTGTGTDGWGGRNPDITDINGTTSKLMLDITYVSDSETIVYDTINLYNDSDFGGPWTTPADLVFTITPLKLLIDGLVVSGVTSDSTINDGIYKLVYWLNDNDTRTDVEFKLDLFVYGIIRNKVYNKLRQIIPIYNEYNSRSQEISDVMLQFSFLKSMEAMAYVALQSELLNALDATIKLNSNGSNYTWQQ